jgi:2,3-dihydroxybiphenyl 1,2-dioxygenase
MTGELELAYVALEVADPVALGSYLGDVVGLLPGEPTSAGEATWRNDDRAQRVVVAGGPADDLTALGLEAVDAEALGRTVERLERAGYETAPASDAERAARRVDDLVSVAAPFGVRVEVVRGSARAADPFASPLVPSGFLTDGVGFGHAVVATGSDDEFEASHRFLMEGLGFRQSDWLEADLGGVPLTVRFYHCNPRHHTLAVAKLPFEVPQRLHHVMVECRSTDDVGAAFDRAWAAGVPIANGLGRHDNDRMFSFYGVTPAGFQVEVGAGAVVVEEPWTGDRRYERISLWGHQPVPPRS